ncbi:DUF4865 family protein [Orbaceae bacterium ESL0727]|nr:DUF4865 family protein [Orbaceae bacterium ESL0727]
MQAMQYKINLPADYQMDIIKNRVSNNGYKTDKFQDLLFKAYLITEKDSTDGSFTNSYCPLYVWKKTEGMTKFIFEGYFDNIISSFGWEHIEIGVTASIDLGESFSKSKFVLEEQSDILEQRSLKDFDFKTTKYAGELGKVVIYNPDKWKYVTFTFFGDKPVESQDKKIYTILHLSLGE